MKNFLIYEYITLLFYNKVVLKTFPNMFIQLIHIQILVETQFLQPFLKFLKIQDNLFNLSFNYESHQTPMILINYK